MKPSKWPAIHIIAQFLLWWLGHFGNSDLLGALQDLFGWSPQYMRVVHASIDFWGSTLQGAMAIFGGVQLYRSKTETIKAEDAAVNAAAAIHAERKLDER